MFEKALILGLYGVTPVHAGSGAELNVIDLPIQRERHTGFPVIWGQSLKGVLRSTFRRLEFSNELNKEKWEEIARKIYGEKADSYIKKVNKGERDPPLTEIIFGPSTEAASEHAGAISVGDAKILLFPVRSLRGVFAYITCPLVLERFVDDLEFVSKVNGKDVSEAMSAIESLKSVFNANSPEKEKLSEAMVFSNDLVVEKDGKKYVVLEDVLLKVTSGTDELKCILDLIEKIAPGNIRDRIKRKIVIVNDEIFTAFVTTTTEIVARIQIDVSTGTVKTGALWYEEYLPSDTLLYSVVAIGRPKISGKNDEERKKNEEKLKKLFSCDSIEGCVDKMAKQLENLRGYIQVGGNETVGKGFVKLTMWGGEIECSEKS